MARTTITDNETYYVMLAADDGNDGEVFNANTTTLENTNGRKTVYLLDTKEIYMWYNETWYLQ